MNTATEIRNFLRPPEKSRWTTSHELRHLADWRLKSPESYNNYRRIVLTGQRRFSPGVDPAIIRRWMVENP